MKLTWRIWLLIIVVIMSLISIFGLYPVFLQNGVLISQVEHTSVAFEQGLRQGQIIQSIDGTSVNDLDDFVQVMSEKKFTGENVKTVFLTDKGEFILFTNSTPEIVVSAIPSTNLKLGMDLGGGSRALVKAQNKSLSSSEIRDLVSVVANRINVYGIADVKVVPIVDLTGNNYMLVELAGATSSDLKKLISEQGKFEAKIGNDTVFIGGQDQGVSSVSRSGQGTGIYQCNPSASGYFCNFRFGIFLTQSAADRQAELTSKLKVNASNPGYLEKPLELFLDDKLVNSLMISEGLKGRAELQISISGSGSGATKADAIKAAEAEMKQLQTVLITGSLPYKLEIIKLDTISPTLGKQFIEVILLAGLMALLAVSISVFARYRKFKISMALILTSFSEIIIILGIAAFISWNLDLLAIAGIIGGIATGIDSQIVLLDESKQKTALSLKEKLKRAFSIILGSYLVGVVSLIPLMWAGAGLLKGFALTTILGITAGILITRPAFSDMLKLIEGD